jgi:hypothetical protein
MLTRSGPEGSRRYDGGPLWLKYGIEIWEHDVDGGTSARDYVYRSRSRCRNLWLHTQLRASPAPSLRSRPCVRWTAGTMCRFTCRHPMKPMCGRWRTRTASPRVQPRSCSTSPSPTCRPPRFSRSTRPGARSRERPISTSRQGRHHRHSWSFNWAPVALSTSSTTSVARTSSSTTSATTRRPQRPGPPAQPVTRVRPEPGVPPGPLERREPQAQRAQLDPERPERLALLEPSE